eukprot:8419382-Alexandrium_andersonii.AAC.1
MSVTRPVAFPLALAPGPKQAELPALDYRRKLTASLVQRRNSVGAFTALLVLTDFADAAGAG